MALRELLQTYNIHAFKVLSKNLIEYLVVNGNGVVNVFHVSVNLHTFSFRHFFGIYLGRELLGHRVVLGEGTSDPLQYSCLETPMDGRAW